MAKSKTLTYNELVEQVSTLDLADKLTLLEDLKKDIDDEQARLTMRLEAISKTKSKINGEWE